MAIEFRDLRADEIDVRVAAIKKKGEDGDGLSLLLYKNARCDMNILDETVGAENWTREHYECKGNLFCQVGINVKYDKPDEFSSFICKSDCGSESNTEKEKGEASDSFKRACFNWGIGRELYTAPFIWVKASDCNIEQRGNKYVCRDHFIVSKIEIENKKIIGLEIYNEKNKKTVFEMHDNTKQADKPKAEKPKQADEPKAEKPKADIICPKCGKVVKPIKGKDGKTRTPEQVLAQLNMCGDCYKKAKANEKTDVQT